MPKISVVIPIYNKEEFLIKCLKSVLNQTLDDIEIICVNDFSSDNSLKIINEYRLKDERIKLINFDLHKGVSCARNEGIKIASAPYIGFVDADDFIDLDFYKNLYNKTQKLNPDIVKGELWGLNRLSDKPFMPICYDLNSLIKKNKSFFFYTFTSAIYKKSLIMDNKIFFPESLSYFEDCVFTIKAAFYSKNIEIVDNAKYYYNLIELPQFKKRDINADIDSLYYAIKKICDFLSYEKAPKNYYLTVFVFLYNQLLENMDRVMFDDMLYSKTLSYLEYLLARCLYRKDFLAFYHITRRKMFFEHQKNEKFRILRAKLLEKQR